MLQWGLVMSSGSTLAMGLSRQEILLVGGGYVRLNFLRVVHISDGIRATPDTRH